MGRVTNDLELDGLAVELDGADLKVDADGRDVALGVRVVRKAQQQTALAHTAVADEEELEQVVAVRARRGREWESTGTGTVEGKGEDKLLGVHCVEGACTEKKTKTRKHTESEGERSQSLTDAGRER